MNQAEPSLFIHGGTRYSNKSRKEKLYGENEEKKSMDADHGNVYCCGDGGYDDAP